MAEINGADVLISIGANVLGSQRDATIEQTTEEIDESSKTSRNKKVAAGRYGSTISLEALYVPTDTAYLALRTAMRAGTTVTVSRAGGGVTESASAIITSLSEGFPDQDGATVSISLTIDGAWS